VKSNPTKPLPSIWEIIDRIQYTLGLKDSFLAEVLNFTPTQLVRNRLALKPLSLLQVEQLASALKLGFENLITGSIDYRTLAQHHSGNQTYLPEKYQHCALGKRRSNLVILNFIENFFGWRERAAVLRHFQMTEAMFANPDAPISIAFGADLLDYLVKYRLDVKLIPQIGKHSFLTTSPAPVRNELIDCKSVSEIYERMCSHIVEKYFEKNFTYQIKKMDSGSCVVIAKPNSLLLDQLEQKKPFKPETEMVRIGIASAYPQILGLPSAQVIQSASMWEGSSSIRYEINYEHAKSVLKQRIDFGGRDLSQLLN
jgi:hypothetical protein